MIEYLEAFTAGLYSILPFSAQGQQSFLFMMLGMAIGFVVGILHSLSVDPRLYCDGRLLMSRSKITILF